MRISCVPLRFRDGIGLQFGAIETTSHREFGGGPMIGHLRTPSFELPGEMPVLKSNNKKQFEVALNAQIGLHFGGIECEHQYLGMLVCEPQVAVNVYAVELADCGKKMSWYIDDDNLISRLFFFSPRELRDIINGMKSEYLMRDSISVAALMRFFAHQPHHLPR